MPKEIIGKTRQFASVLLVLVAFALLSPRINSRGPLEPCFISG